MSQMAVGPRSFLKKIGLQFDKSPEALNRAFLKSFAPEHRSLVEDTLFNFQMGIANVRDIYSLPQTDQQLTLLVSHDANRMVASIGWIKAVVDDLAPASIFEVGCGGGYLLRYLRKLNPHVTLGGIDRQDNFTRILENCDANIVVLCGDVFSTEPSADYELIVCDFGWDNHDIPHSKTPHSVAEIAGQSFCPGCSDDLIPHYRDMLAAWKKWGTEGAKLAVTGRLMDVTELRAFVLAAQLNDWHIDLRHARTLRSRNGLGEPEKFPALVFTTEAGRQVNEIIEFLVEAYARC